MTTNLLKRLESSVASFRLTLEGLKNSYTAILEKIEAFKRTGRSEGFADIAADFEDADPDDDSIPMPGDTTVGKKVQISLEDMDLPSWEHDLSNDLVWIELLLEEMAKVTPADVTATGDGNVLNAQSNDVAYRREQLRRLQGIQRPRRSRLPVLQRGDPRRPGHARLFDVTGPGHPLDDRGEGGEGYRQPVQRWRDHGIGRYH